MNTQTPPLMHRITWSGELEQRLISLTTAAAQPSYAITYEIDIDAAIIKIGHSKHVVELVVLRLVGMGVPIDITRLSNQFCQQNTAISLDDWTHAITEVVHRLARL